MESVRPTDEVYEGDHMGESSGFFGGGGGTGGWFLRFHIAACLFTPVHPRHCPQDDAFLTPIAKLPPPHTAVWTPQLPRNPHTCVQWRGTDQETPQRPKTVYACMNV